VRRFGVAVPDLVVVHDELDLPPAALKLKVGGGLAGHNGLRSIKAHLKDDGFIRVRIGVGKPPGGKEQGADHVLKRFSKADREAVDVTIGRAADAVELIVADGIEVAMNRCN
jgi:PTH1 family peptidyl-tRNA hydrolase